MPIVGGIALLVVGLKRRGGDEALPVRIACVVFPILDPKSQARRTLTPRAIVLWFVGVVIFVAYAIYEQVTQQ